MMRGVFMEKIISLNKVRRKKSPVRTILIIILIIVSAIAVGVYFFFNPNRYKERSQGTYVLNKRILDERGYNLEAASQVTYVLDTQLNWADATIINGGARN
jgi:flagellar basal body-associated protein FliL